MRTGTWVHFGRYYEAKQVGRIDGSWSDGTATTYDIEALSGRIFASYRASEIRPLSPEEASEYEAQRQTRLEKERERKVNRATDVSGRSHFARMARRR